MQAITAAMANREDDSSGLTPPSTLQELHKSQGPSFLRTMSGTNRVSPAVRGGTHSQPGSPTRSDGFSVGMVAPCGNNATGTTASARSSTGSGRAWASSDRHLSDPDESNSVGMLAQSTAVAMLADKLASNRGAYGEIEIGADLNLTGEEQHADDPFLMRPDHEFRKWWDLFQAAALVFIAVVVPYRVGFRRPANGMMYWIELLIDLYFVMDLILNFFTGYEDQENHGNVVMDRRKIAMKYIRGWFFVDAFAVVPIDMTLRILEGEFWCSLDFSGCDTGETSQTGQLVRLVKLLRLFRLLKLLRLARIQRIFSRYQDDLFKLLHLITLSKLMVMLLYLGHVLGCFYNFSSLPDWRTDREIEQIAEQALTTWHILEYGSDEAAAEAPALQEYVTAMYWAFTTMTTVGYGDISARTVAERSAAIIGMIAGGFMFSYIIGTITEVIASIDLSKRTHAKKMQCVSAFVRDNALPQKYVKETLRHFRGQYTRAYSDEALLSELPFAMRDKIIRYKYDDIISKVPIFVGATEYMIVELCSTFRSTEVGKAAVIFSCGEVAKDVFFVGTGQVDFVVGTWESDKGKAPDLVSKLKPGSCFGEELVMGERLRLSSVHARVSSTLYYVVPSSLDYCVRMFPALRGSFRHNYTRRAQKLLKAARGSASVPEMFNRMRSKTNSLGAAAAEYRGGEAGSNTLDSASAEVGSPEDAVDAVVDDTVLGAPGTPRKAAGGGAKSPVQPRSELQKDKGRAGGAPGGGADSSSSSNNNGDGGPSLAGAPGGGMLSEESGGSSYAGAAAASGAEGGGGGGAESGSGEALVWEEEARRELQLLGSDWAAQLRVVAAVLPEGRARDLLGALEPLLGAGSGVVGIAPGGGDPLGGFASMGGLGTTSGRALLDPRAAAGGWGAGGHDNPNAIPPTLVGDGFPAGGGEEDVVGALVDTLSEEGPGGEENGPSEAPGP